MCLPFSVVLYKVNSRPADSGERGMWTGDDRLKVFQGEKSRFAEL